MLTDSDDNCRMLPDAHACELVNEPEAMNVPAEDADQMEIAVIVSDVPPLVHCGVPEMEIVPDEEVPNVTDWRVALPTDAEVVPAAPGAAVCKATNTLPEVV